MPSDPNAQKFADFFNANYNEFANLEFPVHDPTDPTGQRIIDVKIFAELQDAMKAVTLARFFRDNNIPDRHMVAQQLRPADGLHPGRDPNPDQFAHDQ